MTVVTLALGVAGTAAVAGVARQLLLEPLPIRAEEEVVAFHHELSWSEAEYAYLRPELDGFEELAAFRPAGATLLRDDAPALLVEGISATSGLFRLLGREAALGTTFRPDDELPGSEPVVVLSHALWRDLGADAGDRDPDSAVLVVNEAWVARYSPGESPAAVLGRRVTYTGRWDRIVGVVGNVAEAFLSPDPVPTLDHCRELRDRLWHGVDLGPLLEGG